MDRATKKDYIDQLDALVEDPAVQRDDEASNETDAFNVLVSLSDDDLALATTSVARALYERRGARPSVLYVIEIGPSVPEAAMVSDPRRSTPSHRAITALARQFPNRFTDVRAISIKVSTPNISATPSAGK